MENKAPMRTLNSIRALRGIAVILVVSLHVLSMEQKYAGDRILGDWWAGGWVGVDLFFVISGFIMVYVTTGMQHGPRSAIRFLFSRMSRIYPLYWIITLLIFLLWLKAPELVFSSATRPPDILRSFLLFPAVRDPLLVIGWTLIHEMYFYLIFTAGIFLPRKWLWLVLAVMAGVAFVGYGYTGPKPPPIPRIIFSPLIFEFLGGALAAFIVLRWKIRNWKLLLVLAVSLFCIGLIYAGVFGNIQFQKSWHRALLFAPLASFLVLALVVMEQNGKFAAKGLLWIGDQSYSLYLTHVLTLSVAGRIWQQIAMPGIWDNILAIPILFVLSLGVGQYCFVWVERPLLVLAHRLRDRYFQ